MIAIGVLLYKNWDKIKEKCTEIVENVKKKFTEMKENVKNAFNNIKDAILNTPIGQAVGKVWGAAKETLQESLSAIKNAYNSHGGGMKGACFAVMEAMKQRYLLAYNFINKLTGGKLGEAVGKAKEKMTAMKDAVGEKLTAIKTKFTNIFNAIKTFVTNIFDGIKTNISNKINGAKEIISGALGAIKALFNGDITAAKTWGLDMIQNFIDGIKSKIQAVKDAATDIAETVKDILGFSEPKKGPLSNFHTYGPDMMKLYSQGITDYSYLVRNAVSDVATDVSLLGAGGLSSDEIYNAVRSGSEDAEIGLSIGEREFTRYLRNIGVSFNA